jgi:hypothetical protein
LSLAHREFKTPDHAVLSDAVVDQRYAEARGSWSVQPLFEIGDRLGPVGVYGFALAAAAMSVVLFVRYGVTALAVAVLLLGASYSFFDSHIFSPRGVYTMLVIAAGFGLAAWISSPTANSMPKATTAGHDRR